MDNLRIDQNEELQHSVLGHMITDKHFLERCIIWTVTPSWFLYHMDAAIARHLFDFKNTYMRFPTLAELGATIPPDRGIEFCQRFKEDIAKAVIASKSISQDVIGPQLRDWAAATALLAGTNPQSELSISFSKNESLESWLPHLDTLTHQIGRIREAGEVSNRFMPTDVRVNLGFEEADRLKTKIVKYGINFLDEATCGIAANELVIIGSKSGKGKTELCAGIARSMAKAGKRIHFFALEANENEIEMRITWNYLSRAYWADHPNGGIHHISYGAWITRTLDSVLGSYEAEAKKKVKEELKTLNTFYKVRGDFTINNLQNKITDIRNDSDGIIIDHLGFVDARPGTDIYESQAKITSTLRDLSRDFEIPIILVAHLRKSDRGRGSSLVPDQEDFSGSAGIFQVANTVIMMSSASRVIHRYKTDATTGAKTNLENNPNERLYDTFFAVRKSRIGGEITNSTAILRFDARTNQYIENYAIGQLTDNDSEWEPYTFKPHWAKNGYIIGVHPTKKEKPAGRKGLVAPPAPLKV